MKPTRDVAIFLSRDTWWNRGMKGFRPCPVVVTVVL